MFKKLLGFGGNSKAGDASPSRDVESVEACVAPDRITPSPELPFHRTVLEGLWERIPVNANDEGFAGFINCWGFMLSDVLETQLIQELALQSDGFEDLYHKLKASDDLNCSASVPNEIEFLEQFVTAACVYQSCFEALENHMDVLVSKRRQLIRLDEFGDEISDDWLAYFDRYFSSKLDFLVEDWITEHSSLIYELFPLLICDDLETLGKVSYSLLKTHHKIKMKHEFVHRVMTLVHGVIVWAQISIEEAEGVAEPMPFTGDGHEYEYHLLRRLQKETPVKAEVTRGSGDQGADLVVYFGGETFIVQAKHYTSAVGNKAVQEAYSAQSYYSADHAIVVTNAGFTRSALELATSTGVHCWTEVEFVSFFSREQKHDERFDQEAGQVDGPNILEVIGVLFAPDQVSVEAIRLGNNQVTSIFITIDDTDLVLLLGADQKGSIPDVDELEHCINLAAKSDESMVIKVVPDYLGSDQYEEFEDEYGDEITFLTIDATVELLHRISRTD